MERTEVGAVAETTATEVIPPPAAPVPQPPRRVLLKLSGEVFGGGAVGIDPDVVHMIARQIAEVVATA